MITDHSNEMPEVSLPKIDDHDYLEPVEAHLEEEPELKREAMIEDLRTVMAKNCWEVAMIEQQTKLRVRFLEEQNKRLKCVVEELEKEEE